MNNARQETVADIVREMRIGDLCAADTTASRPEYINDFLTSYADRIEAAWKREREAGAEAAQICGKIGKIVGRATTEKSSAVINMDTVRGIAQEMLNTSMQEITAEVVYGWASRLADACKQSVTDCNQLGNTAKMREALEQAKRVLHCAAIVSDILKGEDARKAFNAITAALSAPPRNCDRYTDYGKALRAFENDENAKSSYWGMDGWLFAEAKGETK